MHFCWLVEQPDVWVMVFSLHGHWHWKYCRLNVLLQNDSRPIGKFKFPVIMPPGLLNQKAEYWYSFTGLECSYIQVEDLCTSLITLSLNNVLSSRMLSDCYWWKMAVSFLPADCRKQLLARSLHSAHVSPNNGVLQPVHIHERPEVCERCPSFGDTAAGGRAAGGKTSVTVVSRAEILAGRQSGLWANTRQPVFLMFKKAVGLIHASWHFCRLSAPL